MSNEDKFVSIISEISLPEYNSGEKFTPLIELQRLHSKFPYSIKLQGEPQLVHKDGFFQMLDSNGSTIYGIPSDPELMDEKVRDTLEEWEIIK